MRLAERFSSLTAFIETYTLDPVTTSPARSTEQDGVTLITVHSAKGTKAHVCYITRAQPSNYPHPRALGNLSDEEEEERRVLLCPMTNAQFPRPSRGRFSSTQVAPGARQSRAWVAGTNAEVQATCHKPGVVCSWRECRVHGGGPSFRARRAPGVSRRTVSI